MYKEGQVLVVNAKDIPELVPRANFVGTIGTGQVYCVPPTLGGKKNKKSKKKSKKNKRKRSKKKNKRKTKKIY
jgi:hypothetical protein